MRTETFDEHLYEEGSGAIKVTLRDTDSNLVPPVTAFFHVTTLAGEVIVYNRELTSLSSVMYIVLSGSDLVVKADEIGSAQRLVVFFGTYNDANLGDNMPFKRVYKINIKAIDIVAGTITIEVADTVFAADMIV